MVISFKEKTSKSKFPTEVELETKARQKRGCEGEGVGGNGNYFTEEQLLAQNNITVIEYTFFLLQPLRETLMVQRSQLNMTLRRKLHKFPVWLLERLNFMGITPATLRIVFL